MEMALNKDTEPLLRYSLMEIYYYISLVGISIVGQIFGPDEVDAVVQLMKSGTDKTVSTGFLV
jgi:hypothetical protein